MGDEASSPELIALYGKLKWDDKDYDQDALLAMRQLLEIGSKDCIIAVLKRFSENVGSPEYRPSASPRSEILSTLMWKYPDDDFFKPYRNYLASPFSYTLLDSTIGGTEGVEKLYSELKVWVRKKYDYELNLDGAEPKIKATAPVGKYFRKGLRKLRSC